MIRTIRFASLSVKYCSMAPKRKAPSRAASSTSAARDALPSPPRSPSVLSAVTADGALRRSGRAITKRVGSYAHDELMDDPGVFEASAAREASPDQTSELSEHPSMDDVDEEELMTDDSMIKPVRKRKTPTKRAKSATSTPAQKRAASTQSTPAQAEDEVEYDEDGEPIPKKAPTKADKLRARQALQAERYEQFEPRPPAIDSDYVPVPWKGRLGYACLNTILRSRKEPVFCSRTTRIATIEKEDHGMPFLLELGRQNAADLPKMIEWNEQHGIRFFRLSSEMFPFASHEKYMHTLGHADKELREAGALCNKYGHRVTTHPGQFTQIASPHEQVIINAVRDLEYHNEMLTRMRLDPQRDRDAVMVLHLGGAYGDKAATLQRFRDNYAKLSEPIKRRLVLENDDMLWSVTDLLPLCQELNIPLVLDWHHHNIVHDEQFREGSLDIMPLLPAIAETWTRKNIRQKMHQSEAKLPNHPLGSQRRSHSNRIFHLPPCPDDMDLMLEAKDKEQAVFELSKTYDLGNPPLPPEVVGDGPGAKGDEAYWPEGQEARLKTTRPRTKKEPEYDEDGNEVKTPKKRTPKKSDSDEDVKPRKKRAPKVEDEEVMPAKKKRGADSLEETAREVIADTVRDVKVEPHDDLAGQLSQEDAALAAASLTKPKRRSRR